MKAEKIIPIRHGTIPRYPQKSTVLSDPSLLEHLPSRWNAIRAIAATTGVATLLSLSGCTTLAGAPPMPALMTEADALNIISQTANSYGLQLICTVNRDDLPKDTHYFLINSQDGTKYIPCEANGDRVDSYDPIKKVGFEYALDQYDQNNLAEMTASRTDLPLNESEKGESSILILDPVNQTDSDLLKQQIIGYLDWLKANGSI